METESKLAGLCGFFQSIAHDSSLVEEVLFNVTGDRFGIAFGLARLVVVIYIIGANAIQGHVWSPSVVPDFKLFAQLGQMINAFDESNTFEPFVFQGLIGSFGDSDGTLFAYSSQAWFDIIFTQQLR